MIDIDTEMGRVIFSLLLLQLLGWCVLMKIEMLGGRVFGYVTGGDVFADYDETPFYFCVN